MSIGNKRQKSLLIVGFYFMNTRSAGGHRLQAMAKYMSRKGWDVSVVTASRNTRRTGEVDDRAALSYIPAGIRITQTRYLDLEWMWFWRRGERAARDHGDTTSKGGSAGGERKGHGRVFSSWWKTPARWIRGIIGFPDRQIGWFLPLIVASWRLLRRYRFDVVLTSGPPHSSHLPFLILRNCIPFVWVTDFRDPWTDPPFYAADPRSLRVKRSSLFFNRMIERWVHRRSDCILANSDGNKQALENTFRNDVGRKVVVLTNGFDDELSADAGTLDDSAVRCDFVFTGAVYHWMLDIYLEALKLLREENRRMPVLHIFGGTSAEVKQSVSDLGLDDHVKFKGSVSYEESLWVLKRAKALLLLFIGHRDIFMRSVPSKLYAYLFSGRPYFALVPDGDAARILEEVGGGVVIKSQQARDVAKGISSFLDAMDTGKAEFPRKLDALGRYSWANLSERLDAVLRTAVEDLKKANGARAPR